VTDQALPDLPDLADPRPAGADGFAQLGLDPRVLATLEQLGYEEPTPIQREAIPPLLRGRDVLAEAPTGTGKTAAFALPVLERLASAGGGDGARRDGRVAALILVPTRELAMQVSEAIHRYGERLRVRVTPIYGGQPIGLQLRALRRGVDVVVATPGRAVDHVTRGSLQLGDVRFVVLDEADEMLDMGFAEDLETLLEATPAERQTALFSATIAGPITRIARQHLRDPHRVTVAAERAPRDGPARVRQVAYVVRRADKLAALCRILDVEDPAAVLVFARTRGEVDELADRLIGRGHDTGALHGGMSQEQRDRIMGRFRQGEVDVLVATDVAARGLDIEHVSHVVNYDVPSDPDAYVHRIGRTGRAGREGVAITLVEPREHRLLTNIERAVRTTLTVSQVPTVADLRERRHDVLRADVREAILAGGLDRFRVVVEPLLEEFDAVDVALGALSVADRSASGQHGDEVEIAPATFLERRPRPEGVPDGGRRGVVRRTGAARRPDMRPPGGGGWARLWVGGGRRMGLRPADLVGAITGEAGVTGASVGAIRISDSFSIVEVPDAAADEIVRALAGATIKGRTLPVRRDRTGTRGP
jgi:ATP-dependent RNA helicase DeaD